MAHSEGLRQPRELRSPRETGAAAKVPRRTWRSFLVVRGKGHHQNRLGPCKQGPDGATDTSTPASTEGR